MSRILTSLSAILLAKSALFAQLPGFPGAEGFLGTVSDGLRTVIVNIPRDSATDGRLFGRLKVSKP